ncbi:MAG: glycosyltransferase [Bacteroidetes bacterium]|nr:glycosyltransferase [Bacteroidota bacterium]
MSWFHTANRIITEKPDLVIIRYWLPFMAPALGTIAAQLRKKNIKVIAITDNVIPHEKRIGDSQLTSYFVNRCDGFVAMSAAVLNDLSDFTSNTNKVFLPHPVYDIFGDIQTKADARKSLNVGQEEKLILFFGFIRAYKGLDLLIEAMADERIRNLNIKLLIAGEFYEDAKPYLEKINSIDSGKNFILHTEFIGKEKVKSYFCAADMVVQPYRSATQSGITQIAYHFGRPMLVTNVGGLAEIVANGKAGYVVERDSKAIANAIIDFYSNKKEESFSLQVKADREKFSWHHFIKGVLKLYEKIS